MAKTYNCKAGLANYWDSRHITSLSKEGVTVNTVFDNLAPWHNACNINSFFWEDYNKSKRTVYSFILVDRFSDTTHIYNIFKNYNIKKIVINNCQYYVVPKFIIDENNRTIKILEH